MTHSPLRPGTPTLLAVISVLTACTPSTTTVKSVTAPALTGTQTLVSDRLTFGRSITGGGSVSDSAWAAFVRDVVTPRFLSGFTVWRAEGQWLDPRGDLVREALMIVEVLHPRGAPADSVFSRIATAYIERFHQDAVLRATADVRTILYESSPTIPQPQR